MATTHQAIKPETAPRMNACELSQTVEFGHLSPKMATWVRTYVQNFLDTGTFNPLAATQASYECRTEESARTFGYQLMANPKIILALNRFFGNSPEQSFLEQVERACHKKKLTIAQVDALKLYGELRGWTGRRKHDVEEAVYEPVTDSPQPTVEASKPGDSEITSQSRVPAGATPLRDANGVVRGYKTADGQYIQLAEIEVR